MYGQQEFKKFASNRYKNKKNKEDRESNFSIFLLVRY